MKESAGRRGSTRVSGGELSIHGKVSPQPPLAQRAASSVGLDCPKESREAWGEVTHALKHQYMQKEAAIGDLEAPCDECVAPPSQEHLRSDVPCGHACC